MARCVCRELEAVITGRLNDADTDPLLRDAADAKPVNGCEVEDRCVSSRQYSIRRQG